MLAFLALLVVALRPVAVSVGFGMLLSIPVILVLLPCIVVALEGSSRTTREASPQPAS